MKYLLILLVMAMPGCKDKVASEPDQVGTYYCNSMMGGVRAPEDKVKIKGGWVEFTLIEMVIRVPFNNCMYVRVK